MSANDPTRTLGPFTSDLSFGSGLFQIDGRALARFSGLV
jgi:hypothetical protein